jgi:hypothetical protein
MEGQVPDRETILLAGRFGQLNEKVLEIPLVGALYAHATRSQPIEVPSMGRVSELTQ